MAERDRDGISLERPGARVRVLTADTFAGRARGLLFRAPLRADHALLILPCRSIHTFGMRYAIDVVFLDRNARVVGLHAQLPPWRIAGVSGARAVLEMAAGAAATVGIRPGDSLPELGCLLAKR